jgi:hypothetical protein
MMPCVAYEYFRLRSILVRVLLRLTDPLYCAGEVVLHVVYPVRSRDRRIVLRAHIRTVGSPDGLGGDEVRIVTRIHRSRVSAIDTQDKLAAVVSAMRSLSPVHEWESGLLTQAGASSASRHAADPRPAPH